MMTIEIKEIGPFFHPGPAIVLHDLKKKVEREVGMETERTVQARLAQVLRNPTGRYQSGIRYEGRPDGGHVTDGGIVYGPWLEGTSRRNQTTRFKGYRTFRQVAGVMQGKAMRIADRVVTQELRRLG